MDKNVLILLGGLGVIAAITVVALHSSPPVPAVSNTATAPESAATTAPNAPAPPAARASTIDPTKFGACAAITGDLERTQCYDELAVTAGVAPSAGPAPGGVGAWQISQSTNPVDDTKTVTLNVTANNVKSQFGKDIDLFLRCQSGQTEVFITWNDYLGNDGLDTIMRLDSAKATDKVWTISSDGLAAFYPEDDIAFIKTLEKSSQFVAQATPYNESPVTAIFDLTGLSAAIGPLEQACKWK